MTLEVEVAAGAPIERIEIRNRNQVLETWRPYSTEQLGRRVRIIWEGSEVRGRGRQTIWDGSATFHGNVVQSRVPINQWNLDKQIELQGQGALTWQSLTTGGFGGVEVMLESQQEGVLEIDTALVKARIPVDTIGLNDIVLDSGGGIQRQMRVFRLPDTNVTKSVTLKRRIARNTTSEDALFVCITLEDGHRIWSSPTYILR